MDKDSDEIGRKKEIPKPETGKKETMGTMTMAPRIQNSPPGTGISLPSLQETIPEFFSHHPFHERKPFATSMPRRFSERHSPGPSSAISDSSTGMPVPPSLKRRRLSSEELPLTKPYPVTTVSDSAERERERERERDRERKTLGYPQYPSNYPVGDQRRLSAISSTSQPESASLPPVSSLTSSRGSSFELDPSERTPLPGSLPSLFTHNHNHSQPSLPSIHSRQQYEPDYPRPYSSQGYRYSQHQEPPRQYRAPSPTPISHYSGPPPSHTYSESYSHTRGPLDRSPFSTTSHHPRINMGMDHYEQPIRPGKRRRGNLPKHVTDILRQWLNDHVQHPYPTEEEKQNLMSITGLTMNQISNWFINARRRRLPPRSDDNRNGASSATGSPRPIGGLLPYPPSRSR